jgi:hypothetical protein
MNDLKEVCKILAPKIKQKIVSRILARYEVLKGKVTKQGKPYNTQYLDELLQLAQIVKLEPLIENTILRLRETSKSEPTSIHQFVGSTVPKELEWCISSKRLARLGQWATMFLDTLVVDFHIIKKSDVKIEANNGLFMDGYYLNRQALIQNYGCEGITQPNKKPRLTHRVLGTIWARDGNELDHNDIALELLNNTPLTFNQDVMEKLGYEFNLSEPDKKDWDSVKFPVYEDWVEAREKAHKAYISKLPEYIKKESGVVYNTYAPDSRGRLYPTNDTGNFVGIKYVRAVIQSAEPDKIELE